MRCKPGFRSSGRPTPARRLPIDLRRAASPHAALRQTQRFPPSRQASTSAERVADGDAETMRKQGANFAVLSSRGWIVPDLAVSCPRKGCQNHWFWRRSFLPFFRRRKKGSRRRHDAGDYGLPRAQCALAMTGIFTWGCSGHGAGDRKDRPYEVVCRGGRPCPPDAVQRRIPQSRLRRASPL